MKYKAVVIGTSAGGLNALKTVLPELPANFPVPVVVVQHIGASSDSFWIDMLDKLCKVKVKEADEKERLIAGVVYIAPPNYHLLVEKDETLSLTVDERVNFARPSIDVLFESAAVAFKSALVGVLLTGANHDGARGLQTIKQQGGLTIVQDPATAESPQMPGTAIALFTPDYVVNLSSMSKLLMKICQL